MKLKDLENEIGTLSNTSKMPAYSFGISAFKCKVGSRLAKIKGTTCYKCYALTGFYRMPSVIVSHAKRYDAMTKPNWVNAMTMLIKLKYKNLPKEKKYFRWFDSGDIPSIEVLNNIIQVCRNTPDIKHWIPTREYATLANINLDSLPKNLIIRASAIKVNGNPPKFWKWTSTVHTAGTKHIGRACPALKQDGECRDCRACWKKSIKNISYEQH